MHKSEKPTEKPLILAGYMEKSPLSSKGKEGKLEVTLGKWHTSSYLLQEQCKFTVKGADESQRVYTTGCFYSNQVAQPLLIALVRTLLLTLLEYTKMKWEPGNLPFSPLIVSGKKV